MDIALDPKILRDRQWLARAQYVLALLAVVAGLLLLRQWLKPSISRSEIRTAIVEYGAVSTEVQAAGVVVPQTEWVISSPVSSHIEEVYLPLGSAVKMGDAILKVESTQIEADVKELQDQLSLKDLEVEALTQQQAQTLRELQNEKALADIDLQNQRVTLNRYETLIKSNIVSQFDYEKSRLDVQKSELQLQQLAQGITDAIATNENKRKQIQIEKQLLQSQLEEQQQLLHDTTIRATATGIVTLLISQLGQNVTAGDELLRISDVSGFRVDATVSDFYLYQLSVGMPVNIKVGNGKLSGRLDRILPAVDNGTIRLQIALDEPGSALLKQSQRVEAGIVTESRAEGLRVAHGITFNGSGLQNVFVVRDGEAVKRQVNVGLQNSANVEIVSGLDAGDEIIISDTAEFQHLDRIAVDD